MADRKLALTGSVSYIRGLDVYAQLQVSGSSDL